IFHKDVGAHYPLSEMRGFCDEALTPASVKQVACALLAVGIASVTVRCIGGRQLQSTPMAKFHTLDDIDLRGKTVLLRAELNAPVKDGRVTDATRIERLARTIETLVGKDATVVVMSHFGRPKGKPDPAFSLRPLVEPLERAIGGRRVAFAQ